MKCAMGRVMVGIALLAIVAIGSVGCAADERPEHVEPEGGLAEGAMLQANWGTFISEIDGAKVDMALFRLEGLGGNEVVVGPGVRRLTVLQEYGNGQWHHRRTSKFNFVCEKGHVYTFSADSMFDKTLSVTDETRGESMRID